MSTIFIRQTGITELETDAIVNAANEGLLAGGGVCGAIFRAAGYEQLQKACAAIGHCATGCAVITPAFHLNAKYIIHTVGPVWQGGDRNEPELLNSAYRKAMELAVAYDCGSIGFPLISAGIYGYPVELAWQVAMDACQRFLNRHRDKTLDIEFAVLNDRVFTIGQKILERYDTAAAASQD